MSRRRARLESVTMGTFVTTVTDVVGFFSFLGVAAIWLAQA